MEMPADDDSMEAYVASGLNKIAKLAPRKSKELKAECANTLAELAKREEELSKYRPRTRPVPRTLELACMQ